MNTIQNKHGESQFKPNTTVAAVIHCQGKFLLVEEMENGKAVFNQPAGHLEIDENLITACKRETREETGLDLTPEYLNGIYYYHRPELNLYFMRVCFVIELTSLKQALPLDDEIIATHWLSLAEIKTQVTKLRSPMVLECIEDYLSNKKQGIQIPLSVLKSNI